MELLNDVLWALQNLDAFLNNLIAVFGPGIYVILFLVLFAETGLIVTPFLPGDSLLFALGALSATPGSVLRIELLIPILFAGAILGDVVNYSVGRFAGHKLFRNPNSRIFRREYLERTQRFYAKHGGKTIILARFVPIIRTFAPFVAGMGEMKYPRFLLFSVGGGLTWVNSLSVAGYIFGNLPVIKRNFHIVILAIIILSVLPIMIEYGKARKEAARARAELGNG